MGQLLQSPSAPEAHYSCTANHRIQGQFVPMTFGGKRAERGKECGRSNDIKTGGPPDITHPRSRRDNHEDFVAVEQGRRR